MTKYHNFYDNCIAESKDAAIAHNKEHYSKLYIAEFIEENDNYTEEELDNYINNRAEEDFDMWEEV